MSFRISARSVPLLLLLAACGGVPEGEGAGEGVQAAEQSIVRGEIDSGHAQVMALMIPNLDGTETLCSATLYSKRTLVTAAHCLTNAAIVFAYHGNDFFGDFEQLAFEPSTWTNWAMAVDWKLHPKWNPTTLNADIAVVHLDRDPPFRPLPLAVHDIGNRYKGDMVEIVGYGGIGSDDNVSTIDPYVKRSGFSTFQGSPKARPLPPNPHPGLGNAKIRAQLMELKGADPLANPCFGDSGGPALMEFFGKQHLVGVGSWTGDFCEEFSYYVRVHDFLPFLITQALKAPR
ncbi:MAG TPA: S1 family peptidase [Polyangiaceae bacterium]